MTDRELLEKVLEGQEKLLKNQKETNNKIDNLEVKVSDIQQNLEGLEVKVSDIKNYLEELETKNASRHIEMQGELKSLRKDLSTMEVVTSSNYADLAKLKAVK
jgi:phage shock protein A